MREKEEINKERQCEAEQTRMRKREIERKIESSYFATVVENIDGVFEAVCVLVLDPSAVC